MNAWCMHAAFNCHPGIAHSEGKATHGCGALLTEPAPLYARVEKGCCHARMYVGCLPTLGTLSISGLHAWGLHAHLSLPAIAMHARLLLPCASTALGSAWECILQLAASLGRPRTCQAHISLQELPPRTGAGRRWSAGGSGGA